MNASLTSYGLDGCQNIVGDPVNQVPRVVQEWRHRGDVALLFRYEEQADNTGQWLSKLPGSSPAGLVIQEQKNAESKTQAESNCLTLALIERS